eukprot:6199779-Pleurochrysis_carterae.AAC.1
MLAPWSSAETQRLITATWSCPVAHTCERKRWCLRPGSSESSGGALVAFNSRTCAKRRRKYRAAATAARPTRTRAPPIEKVSIRTSPCAEQGREWSQQRSGERVG